jgi:hypothetical protein
MLDQHQLKPLHHSLTHLTPLKNQIGNHSSQSSRPTSSSSSSNHGIERSQSVIMAEDMDDLLGGLGSDDLNFQDVDDFGEDMNEEDKRERIVASQL